MIAFDGSGAKRQISVGGGGAAVWSRDGHELFYRRGSDFFRVAVGGLPATIGKPTLVASSTRALREGCGNPGYDVASDGRLLTVQTAGEEAAPPRFEIVLNWFEELKRRVPVRD